MVRSSELRRVRLCLVRMAVRCGRSAGLAGPCKRISEEGKRAATSTMRVSRNWWVVSLLRRVMFCCSQVEDTLVGDSPSSG